MYSCFVHLLYLYRLSWANVIKWKGSLRSPSLFTPDLIVVVLSIYIRRELIGCQLDCRVVIWAKNEVVGGGWPLKVNK